MQVRLQSSRRCLFVCLYVVLVQLTVRSCSVQQQHGRRVSAVHLAGWSILTRMHTALGGTGRQELSNSVLMHVWLTSAVLLLIGIMTRNAGCMKSIFNVLHVLVSHSLKPSEVVYQVRQMSFTKFSFSNNRVI